MNRKPKEQSVEEMQEANREFVAGLLPGGNVSPLYESDHCLLCKSDSPNVPQYYGITDMGHKEPEGMKTSAIGIKVKTKVGSLVPLQIASCSRCRKNFRIAANIRLLMVILLVALSILVLSLDPIETALNRVHPMLALVIVLAMIPVSWLIGTVVMRAYMKSKRDETHFDIEEIPFIHQMVDMGWFQIYGKQEVSRLIFSKERLKGEWFTQ